MWLIDVALVYLSVLVVVAIVTTIRNEIIFRYVMRRMEEVSEESRRLVHSVGIDDYMAPWREFLASLDYSKMMWQLHKWSYESFYPSKERDER